ncbi:MAG: hypothetical protein ACRCYA_04100 [Cetobacterium sp.]|uniref:hypothetical protein n=1 Tax=Cetobacterium sp. TaxID=2071632 RepID=UPI003F2BC6A4
MKDTEKEEVTFTQAEVDKMIADRIARVKQGAVNDADLKVLKKENEQLKKEARVPGIKEAYRKLGGKEGKAFEDFLALNPDLYDVTDISKALEVKAKEFNYLFEKSTSNSGEPDSTIDELFDEVKGDEKKSGLVEDTIYHRNSKQPFYDQLRAQRSKK